MLLQGRVVTVNGNVVEPPFIGDQYEIVDSFGLVVSKKNISSYNWSLKIGIVSEHLQFL